MQETVVVVGRRLAVTVTAALVLPAWAVSAVEGEYTPLTLKLPADEEENVAVHDAVPMGLVPWASVQGVLVPKFAAGPKATVPAGVDTVPGLVARSTTVAVHVEA